MNAKKSKSLRRIAREIARDRQNTVKNYRTIEHAARKVMVGWKEDTSKADPQEAGLLEKAWNWVKKMAGATETRSQQAKEFVPDIRDVTPTTDVLSGGFRFYLQRLKKLFRTEDRGTLNTQVLTERREHLAGLEASRQD